MIDITFCADCGTERKFAIYASVYVFTQPHNTFNLDLLLQIYS